MRRRWSHGCRSGHNPRHLRTVATAGSLRRPRPSVLRVRRPARHAIGPRPGLGRQPVILGSLGGSVHAGWRILLTLTLVATAVGALLLRDAPEDVRLPSAYAFVGL